MPSEPLPRPPIRRRLAALGLDYLVILGWMTVLAAGSLATSVAVGPPDVLGALGPVGAQAVFFTLLTLPVGLYLFLSESGPAQATWGKRRMGLIVTSDDGARPARRQVAIRTAVKLLPWEVAHAFIWQMQAVFHREGYDAEVPVWIFVGLNLVNVAVVVYLAMSLLGRRRGPHDRASRTAVVGPALLEP
jgi:uncharacterized RDD family membrane protein YckC